MSFRRSAPALLWLLSSLEGPRRHWPLRTSGYFIRRRPLAGVGTDQAVSKARLTIVRLMRQKPCCQRCRDLSLAAALYQSAIRRWVPSSGPHLTGSLTKMSSPRCALVTTGAMPLERDRRGMPRSQGMHASPHLVRTKMVRDPSAPAIAAAGRKRNKPNAIGGVAAQYQTAIIHKSCVSACFGLPALRAGDPL